MRGDFLAVNFVLHVISRLVNSKERQTIKYTRVNLLAAIRYNTNDNLDVVRGIKQHGTAG